MINDNHGALIGHPDEFHLDWSHNYREPDGGEIVTIFNTYAVRYQQGLPLNEVPISVYYDPVTRRPEVQIGFHRVAAGKMFGVGVMQYVVRKKRITLAEQVLSNQETRRHTYDLALACQQLAAQDMDQRAIAAHTFVSQATVSKLLKRLRKLIQPALDTWKNQNRWVPEATGYTARILTSRDMDRLCEMAADKQQFLLDQLKTGRTRRKYPSKRWARNRQWEDTPLNRLLAAILVDLDVTLPRAGKELAAKTTGVSGLQQLERELVTLLITGELASATELADT